VERHNIQVHSLEALIEYKKANERILKKLEVSEKLECRPDKSIIKKKFPQCHEILEGPNSALDVLKVLQERGLHLFDIIDIEGMRSDADLFSEDELQESQTKNLKEESLQDFEELIQLLDSKITQMPESIWRDLKAPHQFHFADSLVGKKNVPDPKNQTRGTGTNPQQSFTSPNENPGYSPDFLSFTKRSSGDYSNLQESKGFPQKTFPRLQTRPYPGFHPTGNEQFSEPYYESPFYQQPQGFNLGYGPSSFFGPPAYPNECQFFHSSRTFPVQHTSYGAYPPPPYFPPGPMHLRTPPMMPPQAQGYFANNHSFREDQILGEGGYPNHENLSRKDSK
jgi:hypothetical protein